MVSQGVISRFGPLINARELGGAVTLVAMTVPETRFESVAEFVNSQPEIAHNYERSHHLNMWFIVAVEDPACIGAVISRIEEETGLETYAMPKQQEFELEALFPVKGPLAEADIDLSTLGPAVTPPADVTMSPAKRDLLLEVEDGFPQSATPYEDVALSIDEPLPWTLQTMKEFRACELFRRIGIVPNHYAIGYTENAMTVWDIPDEKVASVGEAVGQLSCVTHCYERPRHADVWPYNFFAMAHGRSPREADARVETIQERIEGLCGSVPHDRLDSARILKKSGFRIADRIKATSEGGR
jgi:DNA-binding Lrp family transcriptional regulator